MYKIIIDFDLEKFFLKIPKKDKARIIKKISSLKNDPTPHGYEKMRGLNMLYRIRVGDYRILYSIEDGILTVIITDVDHRKDAYRKF